MNAFFIETRHTPQHLRQGMTLIQQLFPRRLATKTNAHAIAVRFKTAEKTDVSVAGYRVEHDKQANKITIQYSRKCDAFRALGRLLGQPRNGDLNLAESSHFDTVGLMLDVSRNGVMHTTSLQQFMTHTALMGINFLMLYTEDTFEIPSEPMFGYMRGRYTHDELRHLDDIAHALGIELCPCIQTLGHMTQALQWSALGKYRDTENILLSRDEKTYDFIQRMIDAATAPFRSKRIHLGMDEAYGLGTGKFLAKHGHIKTLDIFLEHLNHVRDLCTARGLSPMIWSDMLFRDESYHGAYNLDIPVPQDAADRMPPEIQPVFWAYSEANPEFYAQWIDRHRSLGTEPIVAGGIWTWNRFWATLPASLDAVHACMTACKQTNVREVFMTMWADGGAECDVFSSLPGLQYLADQAYSQNTIDEKVVTQAAAKINFNDTRTNFRGSCGASFDDYLHASSLDEVPGLVRSEKSFSNVSKMLLSQDPLLPMLEPLIEHLDLTDHYASLAVYLKKASRKPGLSKRLAFPAQLTLVLEIKAHLSRRIITAYKNNRRAQIRRIVANEIPELCKRLTKMWDMHRDLWMSMYKPFGWEPLERRYAGMLGRLKTTSIRLTAWADRDLSTIEELDQKLEVFVNVKPGELPLIAAGRFASASVIR